MTELSQRRRTLLAIIGSTVLLSVGGVAGATLIKSPAEQAAEAGPPQASVLTAPVERRVLRDTVVLRGTVTAAGSFEVTPTGPADGGRAVVTGLRAELGDTVRAGEVIVEVSGRPLYALRGAIPIYRDLRPGADGKDIAQLQAALRRLGHPTGDDPKGFFGAGTKDAVVSFYESIGYDAPTTGEADEEAVDGARAQVRSAERAVVEAEDALVLAKEATKAQASPPPPGTPDPVKQAEQQLEFAKEDLAAAREALAKLIARSGPMVPLAEAVFLPAFPSRISSLNATVGADVSPPMLTLSSGALVVQAGLNPELRGLLSEGLEVEILSELLELSATGEIASIGEVEQDETGGRTHPMTVTPADRLDPRLSGEDVRLTVQAAATTGEVLVVPLAAVSAGADGRTTVTKLLGDGREERVPVTAGVSGDGFVEVTPERAGSLDEGDRVAVGR